MRLSFAVLVLSLPFAAIASPQCVYQAPRQLTLDLKGVRQLQIELNSHDLHLRAGTGAEGRLDGRACASEQKILDELVVTQHREGDRLVLEATRVGAHGWSLGGQQAYLDLNLQLPAALPVSLEVGSGDAEVSGIEHLQAQVGSGDLHVRQLAGLLEVSVGSGDIDIQDIGSLTVGAVGSGDLKANGVRGVAKVGSIGSGDVELRRIGGDVHVQTLGSGDLRVDDVRGGFSVGAVGSGDVRHSAIVGKVEVPHDDD